MRESELKQQPRSVRDEFEKITDSTVDGDQEISQWKAELESALANYRVAREEHDRVRSVLANLQSNIDQDKARIEEIDGQRAESIAAALIEGADFANDDELLASRLDLDRRVERLTIAGPALEMIQRQKLRASDLACAPCARLEDMINSRRGELKLLEARRRHGFR